MEKLGPVETNRFLSLPAKKRIESVKRHRSWQSKLDKLVINPEKQFFVIPVKTGTQRE